MWYTGNRERERVPSFGMQNRPREVVKLPPQGDMSDEDYRETLIRRMDEIDEEKRLLRNQLQDGIDDGEIERLGRGWARKLKDKIEYLTRERTEIRNHVHHVTKKLREKRRMEYGMGSRTLAQEFMRLARRTLSEEAYNAILDEASLNVANQKLPPDSMHGDNPEGGIFQEEQPGGF